MRSMIEQKHVSTLVSLWYDVSNAEPKFPHVAFDSTKPDFWRSRFSKNKVLETTLTPRILDYTTAAVLFTT